MEAASRLFRISFVDVRAIPFIVELFWQPIGDSKLFYSAKVKDADSIDKDTSSPTGKSTSTKHCEKTILVVFYGILHRLSYAFGCREYY